MAAKVKMEVERTVYDIKRRFLLLVYITYRIDVPKVRLFLHVLQCIQCREGLCSVLQSCFPCRSDVRISCVNKLCIIL
jgi:hypothetical protein